MLNANQYLIKHTFAIKCALIFLLSGSLLGLFLRGFLLFGGTLPVPYSHILHAHSHMLFFGWITVTLGILQVGKFQFFHSWIAPFCALGTVAATIAFWFYGYTAPGIVASAAFYLPWGYLIVHSLSSSNRFRSVSALFLIGAIVSTILLPPLIVTGIAPAAKPYLINLFLHMLIDGWITLSILSKMADSSPNRWTLMIYAAGILTAPVSALNPEFEPISVLGRALIASMQLLWCINMLSSKLNILLKVAISFMIGRSILDIAASLELISINRDMIVAHIHARTLGFSSCALLGLLVSHKFISMSKFLSYTIICGAVFMVIGLLLRGLIPSVAPDAVLLLNSIDYTVLVGSFSIAIGVALITISNFNQKFDV